MVEQEHCFIKNLMHGASFETLGFYKALRWLRRNSGRFSQSIRWGCSPVSYFRAFLWTGEAGVFQSGQEVDLNILALFETVRRHKNQECVDDAKKLDNCLVSLVQKPFGVQVACAKTVKMQLEENVDKVAL